MSKPDDSFTEVRQRKLADPARRSFLKNLGFASAAAAAPAATIVGARPAEALIARPEQRAQRYRESDHIEKYYETNRR